MSSAAYMRGFRAGQSGRDPTEIGYDYRRGYDKGREQQSVTAKVRRAVMAASIEKQQKDWRREAERQKTLAYREGYRDGFADAKLAPNRLVEEVQ